ncbi:MAG: preprotein translocase subunit YajC [Candidatus Sumerlaeota bacterium]|nr:preprotein translocase subunit YajC [Candidatus Sumerlaeota bacterium]
MAHPFSWLALAAAEAAPSAPAGSQPNPIQMMVLWFAVIAVFFYLIILRPQRREQKSRQQLLDNLRKGDKVVTVGGVHGWITEVDKGGKTVTVRVDTKTNLKVNRSAISTVERGGEEPAATKDENGKK